MNTVSDTPWWWGNLADLLLQIGPKLATLHGLSGAYSIAIGENYPINVIAADMARRRALEEAVKAVAQPVIIHKGAQIARLYPDPLQRDWSDIDLLVEDPEQARGDLAKVGFVGIGHDQPNFHQLAPMVHPHLRVVIELHRRPNAAPHHHIPTTAEIFGRSQPSRVDIDGLRAPCLEHEFVLHLSHSWTNRPLGRLRDLVDLRLLAEQLDVDQDRELAAQAKSRRVWDANRAALARLLTNEKTSVANKLLMRHLSRGFNEQRDPVRRLVAPAWADSPTDAARVAWNETTRATASKSIRAQLLAALKGERNHGRRDLNQSTVDRNPSINGAGSDAPNN